MNEQLIYQHIYIMNVYRPNIPLRTYLLKQGRSHRLIHAMDIFKVV